MTRSAELRTLIEEYGRLQRLEDITASVRGQRFNGLIARTLQCWGVPARESVRSAGEIDVAFAVDGVRFVLEAKWEKTKADTGHLAKLQKRVRQRLAGTYGVFLSMSGYSAEALRDLADGDRLEVLLIEKDHFEAMLSGLVPPLELFALTRDHAAYLGVPHTTLTDLLWDRTQPSPAIRFADPPERDSLLRHATPGVSATAAVIVEDSRQLGIASSPDGNLLLTTSHGIAAVNLTYGKSGWAVPVAGCHRNPAVGPDGAIYFARNDGIARVHNGTITVVAGGLTDNSTIFTHPSGDIWAICHEPDSASLPCAVRIHTTLVDQQVYLLQPGSPVGATWLSPASMVTVGHDGLRTPFGSPPLQRSTGQTSPMGIAPISDTQILTSGDAVSIAVTDLDTPQSSPIATLTLRPSVTELAVDHRTGELWVAAYTATDKATMPWAAIRLNLQAIQSGPITSPVDVNPPREAGKSPPAAAIVATPPASGFAPPVAAQPAMPRATAESSASTEKAIPPTSVVVQCLVGSVAFDGQWITVVKDGVGSTNKWSRRIHISEVTAVTVKPATRLFHGYIQFTVQGYAPAKVSRWGTAAGRPSFDDPDSNSFTYASNEPITYLASLIEQAIAAERRSPPPASS